MEASLPLASRDCMLACAAAFLGSALTILLTRLPSFNILRSLPFLSIIQSLMLQQVAGRSARRTKNSFDCAASPNDKTVARRRNGLFSNVLPAGQDVAEVSNGGLKSDPFDPSKRNGYLSWDDYFMAIAFLSAHRSKDPNRQVGACLVSQDRVILGIGYNGFPRGCSDDSLPWAKVSVNGDPLQTKYPYVCHAEVNAILNKNHASACGQRLYVTMFPCNECAKIIIQAGVAEVVYFIDKNGSSSDYSYIASRKLLCMAGVKVWQHRPAQQKILVEFK